MLEAESRERVRDSAIALFWLSIVAGLAAWLVLAQVAQHLASQYPLFFGVGQAVLWLYFGLNALAYVRYRGGEFGPAIVLADVVTSLAALLWVAAASGGVASPVLLLACVKVAAYGLVFGAAVGVLAATLLGVSLLAFLAVAGLLGVEAFVLPLSPSLRLELQFGYFLVFTAALGLLVWVWSDLSRRERRHRAEAQRARWAAERERHALGTTNALLRVSNALAHLADPQNLLNTALAVGRELLRAELASALLWSEESHDYRHVAVSGQGEDGGQPLVRERLGGDQAPDLEWVRSLGHCVIVGAPIGFLGSIPRQPALVAPIKVDSHFHGVLQFVRTAERPFTQYDIRLADGLATQLALALERARLVEQSYRLLRAVESTEEGVLILDRGARIRFVNPAFCRLFGYAWEAVARNPATDFAEPPSEGWDSVYESIRTHHHWRGEILVRHCDGSLVPVRLHANSIVDPQGGIEGIVAILEDIRAEKEMQEQLARANRLAAAGELAAGLAHELNNAIAAILGQAALAKGGGDGAAFEAVLQRIEGQAQRMAALVADMLGFARPTPPKLARVRLADLAVAIADLFAPQCKQRRVAFELEDLSRGFEVKADAAQIQQVLMNLLTNALQALPEAGGGRIVVRVSAAGSVGAIEVEDNGHGIAPEIMPRIFDPFFTTKKSGTGLGLSISYAIAREHGGQLTVRSRPGFGATFRLELPGAEAEERQQPATADPPPQQHALVVDDDEVVANALATLLEQEGLWVAKAVTGQEAIRRCAKEDWDAVFLDVRLPDLSGPEVYRWLSEHRPELARRVVFVSGGLWRPIARDSRMRVGSQPTLAKPYSPEKLKLVLEALQQLRHAA
ncbi:Sensor kinase CckA [bacterium HR30]|nr:Sensor kinase CckA [bacterium HR30]